MESKEEVKTEISSKINNPYAEECPNRHLWSEGYRAGYKEAIKHIKEVSKSLFDEKEAECESLRQQIRDMYNTQKT